MTILLLVGAQIPAFDPDLETTPGCTDVGVDAPSVVRIIGKPDFEGEHSSVAGESLPSNSHVTDSIPVSSQVSSLQTTFAQPAPAPAANEICCQPLMPVVTMPWMKRFWAMKKMMNAGSVTSTLPAITVCSSSRM